MADALAHLEDATIEHSVVSYDELVRSFGEVALALRELEDLHPLLQNVAANICRMTGAARCSIFLRDEETGEFRGEVGHGEQTNDALVRTLTAATGPDGFGREIVRTKKPVVVNNAQNDPRPIHATMRFWNIRSMLGVPMRLHGEVVGLVFLDTKDEQATFSESTVQLASAFADLAAAAIAQAKATINLRRSLSKVATQNKLLQQAAAVDERLTRLSVEAASLTQIAELVSELTSKPCAIYGDEYQILAQAMPAWLENAESLSMPSGDVWRSEEVTAAVEAMESASGGVLSPMPAAGLGRRFMHVPILAGEMEWGRLVVMEQGGRFAPLDLHVVRRAAVSVSLEMSVERRADRLERDARSSLLGDLIRGSGEPTWLEHRASSVGVNLETTRALCLVAFGDQPNESSPTAADLSAALEGRLRSPVIATGVTEGVLLAAELNPEWVSKVSIQHVQQTVRKEFRARASAAGSLIASIASPVNGAEDYPRAYVEAQQVLRCLQTMGSAEESEVLTAEDLGPGRLLLNSLDREEGVRFARDVLGVLISSDRGMADLYHTLRVFLECSGSFRRAAQTLSVHGNTIRYRLAKIEELTGLNIVDDGDAQMTARMALLISRISGLEPSVEPGSESDED